MLEAGQVSRIDAASGVLQTLHANCPDDGERASVRRMSREHGGAIMDVTMRCPVCFRDFVAKPESLYVSGRTSRTPSATKTPAKTATKGAAKSVTKSAAKPAIKTQAKSAAKSGTKTPAKSATKSTGRSATRAVKRAPAKAATKAPASSSAKSAGKSSVTTKRASTGAKTAPRIAARTGRR